MGFNSTMQPVICINETSSAAPVYQSTSWSTVVGHIEVKEVFSLVATDSEAPGWAKIKFYGPNGNWRDGYMDTFDFSKFPEAYKSAYSYGTDGSGKYRFDVRRQCRIWSPDGSTVNDKVYSGDQILTDGKSNGGQTYPYRLSINGYVKNGTTYLVNGWWCDTDINIGYSGDPTVYGAW